MADRFPLILNTSTNQIQEIASGDNLDLTGTGINNAGVITATTFIGNLTGNVTGNVTGNINGNLTGTLQTAAQPNITSLGTLSSLNVTGNATIGGVLTYEDVTSVDSVGIITARAGVHCSTDGAGNGIKVGAGSDFELFHNGTNSYIDNNTGDLYLQTTGSGDDIFIESADDFFIKVNGSDIAMQAYGGAYVELRNNNEAKFRTTTEGIEVLDLSNNAATVKMNTSGGYAGALYAVNNNVIALTAGNYNYVIKGNSGGSTELYHTGNAKKLETTSSGISVTGGMTATSTSAGAYQFATSGTPTTFAVTGQAEVTIGGGATKDNALAIESNTTSGLDYDSNIVLARSRGTYTSKGIVQSGDFLGRVGFYGYDGAEYERAAEIAAIIDGTPGTNDMPTRLEFKTTPDGANVPTTKLKIAKTGNIHLPIDNQKLYFGADLDLEILHSGSTGVIDNNTGDLYIKTTGSGDDIIINSADDINLMVQNGEQALTAYGNGSVELYHDNTKRFETSSSGVTVTGTINFGSGMGSGLNSNGFNINFADSNGSQDMAKFGDSGDLKIYHQSNSSYIINATGNLNIGSNNEVRIKGGSDVAENMAVFKDNGSVELYHDAAKKLETFASGIIVYGPEGQGGLVNIYADEGDDNADKWRLHANPNGSFYIQNYTSGSWENNLAATGNGATELYYDNTIKLATSSSGVAITGQAVATGNSAKFQAVESGGATVEIRCGGAEGYIGTQTGHKISFITSGNRTMTLLPNKSLCIGLKGTTGNTSHHSTIGWEMSDGWTKGVFSGAVAGNTPWTLYNENSAYNRYMGYIKFDGGFANYSSNDINLCDERVKKDFAEVPSQWNNIKNIGFKHFRYQEDSSSEPLKIGVVAQQVETIYPDLVDEDWPQGDANPNTHEKNTGDFYKSVKEEQLLMYSVKALQEAMAKIETLEAEVAALKGS